MAWLMFNGRRIDLDQLMGQAQALWQAQAGQMANSRTAYLLSRATLLALFASVVCMRSTLTQLSAGELPALIFPFVIVTTALAWLRRINLQINRIALPAVTLPFHAAPLMQRLSLQVTTLANRVRVMALSVPLPHIHFEDSAAVQSITVFAQRMSRSWLELRAALEALIAAASKIAPARFDLIASPISLLACQHVALDRSPRVLVLRC
jgi:hypothetical protein